MNNAAWVPWMEALGVLAMALAGAAGGWWFSRRPGRWWLLGYFLPFAVILSWIAQGWFWPGLVFVPPVSWMMAGRTEFALTGPVAAMIMWTPLSRLSRPRDRGMVLLLLGFIVVKMSVWPFLAPAFNQKELAGLKTEWSHDGRRCIQTTDYTCGPAAAATALRRLGLPAEEGPLGLAARTTFDTGTQPDVLADALNRLYGRDGLVCAYRLFREVSDLKDAGLVLAIVKFGLLVDHYVTVLEVTDQSVRVADPMNGCELEFSHAEFAERWRFAGLTVRRR